MKTFKAYRLTFHVQVETTVQLNEHQGSAIRGAFYHTLRRMYCMNPKAKSCFDCSVANVCTVAFLTSTMDADSPRGRDIPRPYTIQPPLPGSGHPKSMPDGRTVYEYLPGERLTIGFTFYDKAIQVFPYLLLAVYEMGRGGLGRRTQRENGRWLRGRIRLLSARCENPLTHQSQEVLNTGTNMARIPDIPITHQQIMALPVPQGDLLVRFLTPTRLTYSVDFKKRVVHPDGFTFRRFFQRLADRLDYLGKYFSEGGPDWGDFRSLLDAAEEVEVVENRLRWADVWSYSSRKQALSPIGGIVGEVVLRSEDWSPFWPWIVWGQFTHVGKDAVKGNGMYDISESTNKRMSEWEESDDL